MFAPYTGSWGFDQAAHLLRRTIFGVTKARIQQAVDDGLQTTLDTLFSTPDPVAPPVYSDFDLDPAAGIGETWVDKELDGTVMDIYFNREKTLWGWWFMRMARDNQTIMEKMVMFWHNHFVVSEAGHANMNWQYLNLIRDFALGDFKELTKRMTIDRSMLIYLNGTQNYASEPNENYARELLELFTIGKGDLVAPGDYTNYTEGDIAAIAKALTGWSAWTSTNADAQYNQWAHDTSTKQLSHRFDNATIPNANADEYKNVIDIIFSQDEVARHICRRLYMWFVHYDLNDTIEAEIIEPMSQILLNNNYNIQPALEALLKSEHFFDTCTSGSKIKNPLEYFFSVYSTLHIEPPQDILLEYRMWEGWYWKFLDLEMGILKVPSVAGWRAYYQAPTFYRDWINSASLSLRKRLVNIEIKYLIPYFDPNAKGYDFLKFIETLDNPNDVNSMIDECCLLFFPRPMTTEQKTFFKEALIPGLPDFEWTVEYNGYLSDPNNVTLKKAVEDKLESMFFTMFGVPEFQLH